MKSILVAVLVWAMTLHVEAQQCPAAANSSKVVRVYFANGMFTSQSAARRNLAQVREAFEAKFQQAAPDTEFLWAQAYNENEKTLNQLIEVVLQKVGDEATGALIKASDFVRVLSGAMEAPDWFKEERKRITSSVDEFTYTLDADLRKHVTMYRNDVLAGRRVIVLGHSQGNFYTNAAYNLLYNGDRRIETKSVGVLAAASPASRVADGGPHVTFREDLVINGVRLVFPNTLAGNVDFVPFDYTKYSGSLSDNFFEVAKNTVIEKAKWVVDKVTSIPSGLKAHDLSSYLTSPKSQELLLQDGLEELRTLQAQRPAITAGAVSVALDWDLASSDVDLYVDEPSGKTVYYGDPQGVGRLDRDVRDQPGPEHYHIPCDSLKEGTYLLKAKYHSGAGAETARIEVTAGSSIRSFSKSLSTSGRATEPVAVATLVIAVDASGNWSYDVQPAP